MDISQQEAAMTELYSADRLPSANFSGSQARYWMGTLPCRYAEQGLVFIEGTMNYLTGQQEIGEGGLRHYQFVVAYKDKKTLRQAKQFFPVQCHLEPTRSKYAYEYVAKDDTCIPGTRFAYVANIYD